MQAAPREETGVSAVEAALQQQLVVPGQLPPPSDRPADMEDLPALPAVIPLTVRSYAQAAASSLLDGADWVYVAWKLQMGERVEVVSRDRLKPHLGSVAPRAAVPPTCGRPRTASVAQVVSPSSAKKPGGPVYCVADTRHEL